MILIKPISHSPKQPNQILTSSPIFLFPLSIVKSASFRNDHLQFLFQVAKQVISKQVSGKFICRTSHCTPLGHNQSRDPVSKPVAGRGPAEAEHVTGIKHRWEGKEESALITGMTNHQLSCRAPVAHLHLIHLKENLGGLQGVRQSTSSNKKS